MTTPDGQDAPHAGARSMLAALVRKRQVPGISHTQVSADGLFLEAHAGRADAGSEQPADAATQYMAYSVTKVLTAIAVLQLADRGRLELDAPLARYVAEQPYGPDITLRMLLAHTAGVPNPMPLDWFFVEGDPVDRPAALRRVLRANPRLSAAPGSGYHYSNIGYWLLEQTIEAASGKAYATYVSEHLFAPLGLSERDATFELPPADRLARGHVRRVSLLNLALSCMAPSRYWIDTRAGFSRLARVRTWGLGYGGAYATAGALTAVLRDLLQADSKLLSAAAKQALYEPARTTAGKQLANTACFGMGELDGVPYFGKQGGGLGFQGNVRIYPRVGLVSAYFANATAVTPGPIDARSDALDRPLVRWLAARHPR